MLEDCKVADVVVTVKVAIYKRGIAIDFSNKTHRISFKALL